MKAVLLCFTFSITFGLAQKRCYSCTHNYPGAGTCLMPRENSDCADPFNSNSVPTVPCSQECMKLKIEANGVQKVIRSCGHPVAGVVVHCIEVENEVKGVKVVVKCCSGDRCNAASALQMAYALVLLLVMAVIFV